MTLHRLDRTIAGLGYGTRREAQRAIRDGRVRVNGRTERSPEQKVDATQVTIDGELLEFPNGLFVAFHKPVGLVCSHADREGERVYDRLPARWLTRNPQVTSIGRLDKDSSGLLLITDITSLVHTLSAPSHHVEKRYVVTLEETVDDVESLVRDFASGVELKGDDTPCRPAPLRALDGGRYEVTLTEGRHRQVRRMFGACGFHVVDLSRRSVGPYELDGLAEGDWRVEDPSRVTGG